MSEDDWANKLPGIQKSTIRIGPGQPMPSSWRLVTADTPEAREYIAGVQRGDIIQLPIGDGLTVSYRVINWEGPWTLMVEPVEAAG